MAAVFAPDMRISILHKQLSWGVFANDFALSVLRFMPCLALFVELGSVRWHGGVG